MSAKLALKQAAEGIPLPLGKLAARVPYALRLGPSYLRARRDADRFARLDAPAQRAWVHRRVAQVVTAAYRTVPFYRAHYDRHGFHPTDLRGFDDIAAVPVVSRDDLQAHALAARSAPRRGRLRRNTGGTSGQPLHFYLDAQAFGREWAHMHAAWATLGYRPHLLKLTFRGHDLGQRALRYNAVHHELQVNAYGPRPALYAALESVLAKEPIAFVHGYPSAIAEFVADAAGDAPRLLAALRGTLRGVLLGSEFPAPPYRRAIEEGLGAPTLSWYGHSEMAVFAYETRAPYRYEPMHTYGYCEAVAGPDGAQRLLGTSYDNLASPFIRYDTGDLVEATSAAGLVTSFTVAHGRVGEFVADARGRRVSLTALVFGRHHRAFERARFVQVRQVAPGRVTLVVTPPPHDQTTPERWLEEFDLGHVDIAFDVELRREPIRTPAGKVALLVA